MIATLEGCPGVHGGERCRAEKAWPLSFKLLREGLEMIRKQEISKESLDCYTLKMNMKQGEVSLYSQILSEAKQKQQTCSFLVFVTLLPVLGDLSEFFPGSFQDTQEGQSFTEQEHNPSNDSHLETFSRAAFIFFKNSLATFAFKIRSPKMLQN